MPSRIAPGSRRGPRQHSLGRCALSLQRRPVDALGARRPTRSSASRWLSRPRTLEILPPASLSHHTGRFCRSAADDRAPDAAVDVDVTSFAAERRRRRRFACRRQPGWTVAPAAATSRCAPQATGNGRRSQSRRRTRGVTLSFPSAAVFTTSGREWRTRVHRRSVIATSLFDILVKDATSLVTVVDLHVDKGVRVRLCDGHRRRGACCAGAARRPGHGDHRRGRSCVGRSHPVRYNRDGHSRIRHP